MTPLEIEILLHCYSSAAPHPRIGAPAVNQAIKDLKFHELIEDDGLHHATTERGNALVRMLCQTPFPAMRWVDPRTNETVAE